MIARQFRRFRSVLMAALLVAGLGVELERAAAQELQLANLGAARSRAGR